LSVAGARPRGRLLERIWFGRRVAALPLLPLSALFWVVATLRRLAYRWGVRRSEHLPVPVIVVGNLTVGGAGKTPLVIWLARHLRARGIQAGVLSRGYGGSARSYPLAVTAATDPRLVGDEPVLIAQRAGCPVVVDPDRARGGRWLLGTTACDLLVADDGLQHLRLARDLEIVVVDGERRFGNGFLLPAGPLREGRVRLARVDLVVVNGGTPQPGELAMRLHANEVRSLARPDAVEPIAGWRGRRVHAVAGIGNPGRFFAMLEELGLTVDPLPFPDHHPFAAGDIDPPGTQPVLMTEKDAVKCRAFAGARHWVVPVSAEPDPAFVSRLDARLSELLHG
jgi:tetraacyldisaccharide 4'-kinase